MRAAFDVPKDVPVLVTQLIPGDYAADIFDRSIRFSKSSK
jgi:hypothetical protein